MQAGKQQESRKQLLFASDDSDGAPEDAVTHISSLETEVKRLKRLVQTLRRRPRILWPKKESARDLQTCTDKLVATMKESSRKKIPR